MKPEQKLELRAHLFQLAFSIIKKAFCSYTTYYRAFGTVSYTDPINTLCFTKDTGATVIPNPI